MKRIFDTVTEKGPGLYFGLNPYRVKSAYARNTKMPISISIPTRIFIEDDLDSSMAVDYSFLSDNNTKMIRAYGKFQHWFNYL